MSGIAAYRISSGVGSRARRGNWYIGTMAYRLGLELGLGRACIYHSSETDPHHTTKSSGIGDGR